MVLEVETVGDRNILTMTMYGGGRNVRFVIGLIACLRVGVMWFLPLLILREAPKEIQMPRVLSHYFVVTDGALLLCGLAVFFISMLLPGYVDSTFDEPVYTYSMNVSAI